MREVAEWRRRRGKRKAPGRLVLGGRELGSRAVSSEIRSRSSLLGGRCSFGIAATACTTCATRRDPRSKPEQMLKFRLAPLALEVIRKSGTVQEYRKIWQAVGKPAARDGARAVKEVEYWGLVAIIGPRPTKVRVILRRVGDGNVVFWSVMRGSKILRDGAQRLAPDNLEDD